MDLPFSRAQFLEVFARYNEAVWPMQVALLAFAAAALWLLRRARPGDGRAIGAILAFLWAWMAVAYHFAFFTTINSAAWLFGAAFLAGAGWMGWVAVVRARLQFGFRSGWRGYAAAALIAYALVAYPVLGFVSGLRYPAVPTFGLPCPTTIFTLGMLLCARPTVRSVFVVPLLWSALGTVAALELGVIADLGLLAAGVVAALAIALPARERDEEGGHEEREGRGVEHAARRA